jgi:hypothetical protein
MNNSIFLFFLISCTNFNNNKITNNAKIYKKDDIEVKLVNSLNSINKVEFLFKMKSKNLQVEGQAELILIEDIDGKLILPEGTNRIDYNNPSDIIGIKCDSTYYYNFGDIKINFAPENKTNERLDFNFSNGNTNISKTLLIVK